MTRRQILTVCTLVSSVAAGSACSSGKGASPTSDDSRAVESKPTPPSTAATTADGYVATPFGYLHTSCVHEVKAGDVVERDGSIRRIDGRLDAFGACAYPKRATANATQPVVASPVTQGLVPPAG